MTREALIEQVTAAFRERVRGVIRSMPAWHDLDEAGRIEAYEATVSARELEAALDPNGLSSTAHAVLARIDSA